MNQSLGLSTAEANKRLEQHGRNVLRAEHKNPWWKILMRQFTDVLVLILIAAAFLSYFSGEHEDAFVIMVIVLLNGVIGFVQEFRTEQTLASLKNMLHPEVRVWRDGTEQMLSTEELVPGDVVQLQEGDKIPADGVLLVSNDLRVEESALTGESVPVEKGNDSEVYMGTSVAYGGAQMKVTETGMETKFGEIAHLTTSTKATKSPLQRELETIGMFVAKLTGVISLVLFIVGFMRGEGLLESLMFSVSVAIAAVPEGLPTTVTIALALGASVLARKNAIVKRLSSVETLGAVTTICTDKTGTLTKNQMTVREVYLADRSVYHVTGAGYDPTHGAVRYSGGNATKKANDALFAKMMAVCALCNDAKLKNKNGDWSILGDPTEGALLTLFEKANVSLKLCDGDITKRYPFDSERKMMSVHAGGTVLTKGSPDQLLQQCTHWHDGEAIHPMSDDVLERVQAHYARLAEDALRVLAFAERVAETEPKKAHDAEQNLVFLGLVGMIDPPRESAKKALRQTQSAGIRTIMITGDYGITAAAIGHELGLGKGSNGEEIQVITGDELAEISDGELDEILKNRARGVIFARSRPAQKMRIVTALQSHGEVVAMTGDGVNDAPALKKADIGVAMGITGTEVSKEAATMILTDDSFASIVQAVAEGRRIYANLKKFIWFIFACNIGELVTIFAALAFGFPLPLTAILILCIDLGTDILPAIALGVDPGDESLMAKPPRPHTEKVMNKAFITHFTVMGMIIGACVVGAFLVALWGLNYDIVHAQTIAFTSLVFVQLLNAFSARSATESVFRQNPFKNPLLLLAILVSVLLVLLAVYVPALNAALGTAPMNLTDWELVAAATLVPFFFLEMYKLAGRYNQQKVCLKA